MLRSGIALAGANTSLRQGQDYGLVSAEKVLGLRLKGTELVVLSACETGVGDVQTGEGVFGLKRAFILSGARTVVMSLWSVPSAGDDGAHGVVLHDVAKGKAQSGGPAAGEAGADEREHQPLLLGGLRDGGRTGN